MSRKSAVELWLHSIIMLGVIPFLTFISYPGFLHSDAIDLWQSAIVISHLGLHADLSQFSTFHPWLPRYLTGALLALTGQFASFIYLQLLALYCSSLYLARCLASPLCATFAAIAVFLTPIVMMMGCFWVIDVPAAIGMCLCIGGLIRICRGTAPFGSSLAVAAGFILVAGFRLNGVAELPALLLVLFWRGRIRLFAKLSLAVMLLAVSYAAFAGPAWLHARLRHRTSANLALVMDLTAYYAQAGFPPNAPPLDFLGGSTAEAVKNICYAGMFCGSQLDAYDKNWPKSLNWNATYTGGAPQNMARLETLYRQAVLSHPLIMLDVKLHYAAYVLGIAQPLWAFHTDLFERVQPLAVKKLGAAAGTLTQSKLDLLGVNDWTWDNGFKEIGGRPLLLAIICLAAGLILRLPRLELFVTLGLAAFYYLVFLLVTPDIIFRYFFPAFIPAYILLWAEIIAAFQWGWRSFMGRAMTRSPITPAGTP